MVLLYADDAVLLCKDKTHDGLKASSQKEIQNIESWSFLVVTAPIYFICPNKFLNMALLFGSYFCCVGLRVICFVICSVE